MSESAFDTETLVHVGSRFVSIRDWPTDSGAARFVLSIKEPSECGNGYYGVNVSETELYDIAAAIFKRLRMQP